MNVSKDYLYSGRCGKLRNGKIFIVVGDYLVVEDGSYAVISHCTDPVKNVTLHSSGGSGHTSQIMTICEDNVRGFDAARLWFDENTEKLTKSQLRSGFMGEFRNKELFVVTDDTLVTSSGELIGLHNYTADLYIDEYCQDMYNPDEYEIVRVVGNCLTFNDYLAGEGTVIHGPAHTAASSWISTGFRKADLRCGQFGRTRCGAKFVVLTDNQLAFQSGPTTSLDCYTDDLRYVTCEDDCDSNLLSLLDIDEVYANCASFDHLDDARCTLLFERGGGIDV